MKRHILSIGPLVLLAFLAFSTPSCNVVENDTTGASTIIIDSLLSDGGAPYIESDVCVLKNGACTVATDAAKVTMRTVTLNPDQAESFYHDITIKHYTVEFVRPDGKKTQGVDVPYAFTGDLSVTVPVNGTATFSFILVPVRAKLEAPLTRLVGVQSEMTLQTRATVTFYGEDQAGNELQVKGQMTVSFADYADKETKTESSSTTVRY